MDSGRVDCGPKAWKESAKKTHIPVVNTPLALASIRDDAGTDWTCAE